jgi:sugar lactone lactonase YvrE
LAEPGRPFYVADENQHETWVFTANADGTLGSPRRFAEHGEGGVVTDRDGKVYIAEGDIFVYDASGKQVDQIQLPDRPLSMAFCGKDRRTLLIAARTGVYCLTTEPDRAGPG